MAEYHVGCGIAGIYAGRLKNNGYEWIEKSDVTKEVLQCALDYLYTNEKAVTETIDGKKYIMSVMPITENEENELRRFEAKVISHNPRKLHGVWKRINRGFVLLQRVRRKRSKGVFRMNLEEFHEWLKKQPLEDKLVYMKYKYSWEDRWTVSNEYLEVDMSVDGYYVWLSDWNEGQEDVEILGCIDVGEIDVPLFESQKESKNKE